METVGQRGSRETGAERLGGLEGADAGLAEPGDGAQGVGPGRENTGRRAEGVEKDAGEVAGIRVGMRSRQQELEKLVVVDRLRAGSEKAVPELVGARGLAGRARRRGRGEERHLAGRRGGDVGQAHGAALPSLATRPATVDLVGTARGAPVAQVAAHVRPRSDRRVVEGIPVGSGQDQVAADGDAGDRRCRHGRKPQQPAKDGAEPGREVLAAARVHGVHRRRSGVRDGDAGARIGHDRLRSRMEGREAPAREDRAGAEESEGAAAGVLRVPHRPPHWRATLLLRARRVSRTASARRRGPTPPGERWPCRLGRRCRAFHRPGG